MVKTCCVKGCRSESYKLCGISFHRFPKEENLRAKWLKALGYNEANMKSKDPIVCSKHFLITDFRSTTDKAVLKEDAVPFREQGEIILINQEKLQFVRHDDINQEGSDSSNHFDEINIIEDHPEEDIFSESGIQHPRVQCYEKLVQTSAYIGPREEELQRKVKILQKKLLRRSAKINMLIKELKESKEREKRLELILKDVCDTS